MSITTSATTTIKTPKAPAPRVETIHTQIGTTELNGKQIRYIYKGNKKAKMYFVTDLQSAYGNRLVALLKEHIETVRLTTEDTIGLAVQHRDLVAVSKVKAALRTLLGTEKSASAGKKIVKDLPHNQVPLTKAQELAEIQAATKTQAEALAAVYRRDIKELCDREARRMINRLGMSSDEVELSDREPFRDAYRMLYIEFDRIMAGKLRRIGSSLEAHGLGRYKNQQKTTRTGKSVTSYLDIVEQAGFLVELRAAATALFGE